MIVVSRWLVMPIAAMSLAVDLGLAQRGLARPEAGRPDLLGHVLDPARRREVLGELHLAHAGDLLACRRRRSPGSTSCPGRSPARIRSSRYCPRIPSNRLARAVACVQPRSLTRPCLACLFGPSPDSPNARHLQRRPAGLRDHRARLSRRPLQLYPREGVRGLVAFVNNFATPCLLFHAMVTADFSHHVQLGRHRPVLCRRAGLLFASASIIAIKFFGNRPGEGVSVRLLRDVHQHRADRHADHASAPTATAALATTFSIIAFHASVLITIGMLVMELVRRDGAPLHQALLASPPVRIVSNPLLWGIAAGAVVQLLLGIQHASSRSTPSSP